MRKHIIFLVMLGGAGFIALAICEGGVLKVIGVIGALLLSFVAETLR